MPIKKKPQLTAWSFSRLTTYEECALKAMLKFIKKVKEPKGPALVRGSNIHDDAQKYSTGVLKKRPKSLELFPEEFKYLRRIKKKLDTELQIAVDENWNECDWFSPKAWLRVVIDVMYPMTTRTMKAIDYKTGKIRAGNIDQLGLYAAVIFATRPKIHTVEPELWYLDQGEIVVREVGGTPRPYTRANDFGNLKKYWTKRSKKLLADRTFKPTPGRGCTWCHFSKAKGGQCPY